MNNINLNDEEKIIVYDALNLLRAEAKNSLEDDNIIPVERELHRIVEVCDEIINRIYDE
jgi:hypothetical protein